MMQALLFGSLLEAALGNLAAACLQNAASEKLGIPKTLAVCGQ